MIKQAGGIGIFDSGLGGLNILKEVVKLMPDRKYVYLGDNLHAPYGDKSQEDIFRLTLAGVEWLFDNGAEIVILACNTASSNALRKIQREVLPTKYPDKRVLGIILPTVEEIEKFSKSGHIGVLATNATVASRIYEIEMEKQNPRIQIISQSGGTLTNLIEQDNDKTVLLAKIKEVTDKLISKDNLIDTIILGCTHYALIMEEIKQVLSNDINVVGQGGLVATKLSDYLNRHIKIKNRLSNLFSLHFYTTSDSEQVKQLMTRFYGKDIFISTITLAEFCNSK